MYQSSLFCWREQLSVPSFEKGGSEKNDCLGGLKSFCHAEYLPVAGLAMFLVKKTFKDKIWPLVLNFKCLSRPILAK